MKKILFQFNFLSILLIAMFLTISINSDSTAQTTVDITFATDNTLYQDPNGETSNGSGQYFFTGQTAADQTRRGLIKFLLVKDIPLCATITNVSLKLHMSKTISGFEDAELRKVEKDWGAGNSDAPGEEGYGTQADDYDATWQHNFYNTDFWTNDGGDFSSDPSAIEPVGGVGFYTWDSSAMIQDVQNWLDNPESNFGWALVGNERDLGTAKRFDSRENDSANFRPVLTVTYEVNAIPLYSICLIEGFFDGFNMIADSITVSLRSSVSPYNIIDSKTNLSDDYNGVFNCFNAPDGTYYIVVNHRNSIETWSKNPIAFTVGNFDYYDFSTAATQAYGDNQVLKLGSYCIYSGDVNQDFVVDVTDGSIVDNDALNFAFGYIPSDVNGDNVTDLADGSIVDNNASNFVTSISP
ncbi:MAG: DNRLRE domain-containing protein [Ignavibacteria bacterium]